MAHVQTFRLAAPITDVESACRRALRNVDWQELPTDTFRIELPGVGSNSLMGELLIGLLEFIPAVRRFLRTRTLHALRPSLRSESVIYGVWGNVVTVTISLREQGGFGTELTIAAQGGLPGKAAALVGDLRRSIEIQSGSLTPTRRP